MQELAILKTDVENVNKQMIKYNSSYDKNLNLNQILFVEDIRKKSIRYYNKNCSLILKFLKDGIVEFKLNVRDDCYWDGVEGTALRTFDGKYINVKYNKEELRIPIFTIKSVIDILSIVDINLGIKLKDNGYQ